MKPLAAVLALLSCVAAAQDRLSDQPYTAPVAVGGADSHYRFTLPAAAYRGLARRDVGDLRVFNVAGEAVPYAILRRQAETVAPPPVRGVKLFPLYGDAAKGIEATQVRVARSASGTVVNVSTTPGQRAAQRQLLGYLLDVSDLKAPQEALLLQWTVKGGFTGSARVEGSDDLKSWSAVVSNAPVLHLEHAGARLERNRIEMQGARAKFLRLSFRNVPADFTVKEIRVELRADQTEPEREWQSLAGRDVKDRPGEVLFDTEGKFPVDRARLSLPQPNTVAQVQLLSRERSEDPWRSVAIATVYRLNRDGTELRSADIRFSANADRYWLLRVDQKGGGLGAGEARLGIGWLPHEVVFAARGAAPFTVAYGNKLAKSGALPVATVFPGYPEREVTAAAVARVGDIVGKAEPSGLSDPGRYVRNAIDSGQAKQWLLWIALVIGVMLVVWMAFRLLRDLGNTKQQ
jgi:hypothetical protein